MRRKLAAGKNGRESDDAIEPGDGDDAGSREGWQFHRALGLTPVVDARPHYLRFACPDGDSTFSLHQGTNAGSETAVYFECDDLDATVQRLAQAGVPFSGLPEDKSWLWRRLSCLIPAATG